MKLLPDFRTSRLPDFPDFPTFALPYSPFEYKRRNTFSVSNIGEHHVPIVVADFMSAETIAHKDLQAIGYGYNEATDKWNIGDAAADYIYSGKKIIDFALPGTLKVICDHSIWLSAPDKEKYFPLFQQHEFISQEERSAIMNFVSVNADNEVSSKRNIAGYKR